METAAIRHPFITSAIVGIAASFGLVAFPQGSGLAQSSGGFGWDNVPAFTMTGGLNAFWNVNENSRGEVAKAAYQRGFEPVTLLGTYADYPGKQRENIAWAIGDRHADPWQMPPFFERIVKRNIDLAPASGIYVNDIEVPFEEDTALAWANQATRRASGATTREAFDEAYFRQWAEWFWLPLKWTKERYPDAAVGLYGPQPFRRDFWGFAGKEAGQIDGTHKTDWQLWKHIDPYVDFYIASIYVFYDQPDSVYYMAANVEENVLRTRPFGDRPVYAYTWLRFHDSNASLVNQQLPPYLVEAMAIVPYFSGAKGVVLWGFEPEVKSARQQPYTQLPHFAASLGRIARLSDKIGRGKLLIDSPAQESWKAHAPLVRRIMTSDSECVIMAVNPWQSENERASLPVKCGNISGDIQVVGKNTTLAVLNRSGLQLY